MQTNSVYPIIDTHSHLFDEAFEQDLPQVISRARQAGVTHVFMPNIDSTTIAPMLRVCSTYPDYCFPMIGLHPTSVTQHYEQELATVHHYLEEDASRFVAIGEIGIDLYWEQTYQSEQITVFLQQVEWALQYHLPIVIHSRSAFDYIYKVLLPYRDSGLTGIFHSFTGEPEEIDRMLEFPGFLVGINGIATFKKSTLPDTLPRIPLDRLVLETDSPYLAPVPCRGKRNESSYLCYTLTKVAEIYSQTSEEVAQKTTKNALKVFGMLK